MALRLVDDDAGPGPADPRDPRLYRSGLSSARAALREGMARRHEREVAALEDAEHDRVLDDATDETGRDDIGADDA